MVRPAKRQMAAKNRSRNVDGKMQPLELELEDWQLWAEDTMSVINRVRDGQILLNINEVLFDSFNNHEVKKATYSGTSRSTVYRRRLEAAAVPEAGKLTSFGFVTKSKRLKCIK